MLVQIELQTEFQQLNIKLQIQLQIRFNRVANIVTYAVTKTVTYILYIQGMHATFGPPRDSIVRVCDNGSPRVDSTRDGR